MLQRLRAVEDGILPHVEGPRSTDSPVSGSHVVEIVRDIDDECDEHVHHSNRAPWLRALVLGANDGLVSVAALLMGVGSGSQDLSVLRLSGVAALISGALSMAAGEYVSVSSQRDAEKADIHKEVMEQLKGAEAQARELEELTQIYVERGVPQDLAKQVAVALTEHDVIRAHARDELGIDLDVLANPLQAAIVSALCFCFGAMIPLLSAIFISNPTDRLIAIACSTTVGLLVSGLVGSHLGGASLIRGGARVLIGGWLALGVSYGVGKAFNVGVA
jgi:vacuolar iron transporter family protein